MSSGSIATAAPPRRCCALTSAKQQLSTPAPTTAVRIEDFIPALIGPPCRSGWSRPLRLLAQSEGRQRLAGDRRHVLLAVDLVGHRAGHDLRAEIRLPQQLAGARVQR